MTASMISWGVDLQPVRLLSLTQQMIEHIQEETGEMSDEGEDN